MGLDLHWVGRLRHAGIAMAALTPAASSGALPATVTGGPVPPMQIGVNLPAPIYFAGERSFANVVVGDVWHVPGGHGWADAPAGTVTDGGTIAHLPAGTQLARMLNATPTGPKGSDFRCTFSGRATASGGGFVSDARTGSGELRFHHVNTWQPGLYWINIDSLSAGSTLNDLDCREATIPRDALYDPDFVRWMSRFRLLRFKDWQDTDSNPAVRWATRHRPGAIDLASADGVPIEHMMTLVRLTGADPWFSTPWNADADYIRNFAKLVHDTLPPGRRVYVELANEVWNWGFQVTHQAMREGLDAKLTADGADAVLLRYAQKTIETMRIWEAAFADHPERLVRVVATQHVVPHSAERVLGYPGLVAHVDALATAPYFADQVKPDPADPHNDALFRRIDASIDTVIDQAVANKAVAARFGKRYIAYEAGQGIVLQDVPAEERIQRDQRMYDIYRHFLMAWRSRVGDTLTLYNSATIIGGAGGWGLIEHSGQPMAETPKLRAVLEEQPR